MTPQQTRAKVIQMFPWLTYLSLMLKIKETDRVPTAATDGRSIYINIAWWNSLTKAKQLFVLCHELMHVMMLHPFRCGSRHAQVWNIACDGVINALLGGIMTVPDDAIEIEGALNKDAETVYAEIMEHAKFKKVKGILYGDVTDGEQARAVEKVVDRTYHNAHLPNAVKRAIKRRLTSVVNWKDLLRQYVKMAAQSAPRWHRPNRRYIDQGIYLPSRKSKKLNRIRTVLDTSASMNEEKLAAGIAEIQALCMANEHEVLCVDTDLRDRQVFGYGEDITGYVPIGGGCTDFEAGFQVIDEPPDLMVYLTDLQVDNFPAQPQWPVVWGVMGSITNIPYGTLVPIGR